MTYHQFLCPPWCPQRKTLIWEWPTSGSGAPGPNSAPRGTNSIIFSKVFFCQASNLRKSVCQSRVVSLRAPQLRFRACCTCIHKWNRYEVVVPTSEFKVIRRCGIQQWVIRSRGIQRERPVEMLVEICIETPTEIHPDTALEIPPEIFLEVAVSNRDTKLR